MGEGEIISEVYRFKISFGMLISPEIIDYCSNSNCSSSNCSHLFPIEDIDIYVYKNPALSSTMHVLFQTLLSIRKWKFLSSNL